VVYLFEEKSNGQPAVSVPTWNRSGWLTDLLQEEHVH
jgi:hypothetical protein